MAITNQWRLCIQQRIDHKRPDGALKAAVGPDAENMPSVLIQGWVDDIRGPPQQVRMKRMREDSLMGRAPKLQSS
jgi:hypothetical protein